MTKIKKALGLAGLAAVGFGIYKNPAMVQTGFAMLKTAGTAIASLFAGVSFGMMASAVAGIAVLGLVVYKVRAYRAAKVEAAKAGLSTVDEYKKYFLTVQPPVNTFTRKGKIDTSLIHVTYKDQPAVIDAIVGYNKLVGGSKKNTPSV